MAGPDPSIVKDLAFFQGLDEGDIRAILAGARTRRIERKAAVFEQGAIANEFFVLLRGHLKVVQSAPDGRQVIVRIVQPGELYGVAVAIGLPDYPATAIALEESLTLAWPSSAWAGLVRRVPALAENALKTLGQRVQEAHTRIREESSEEIEGRIARVLLRLVGGKAGVSTASMDVGFRLTRKEVAEMTGTTLFTVSRILSRWEELGLVASGRERISVREPDKLRAIAEPPSE